MADWHSWHQHYSDPESSLSRRLVVVQNLLRRVVAELDQRHRILSLCAGDGRDVVPVVAELPAERRPALVLVELDAALAAAGLRRSADSGVAATVIVGDAGTPATWRDHAPVDLLMLCGIFGNISGEDVRTTIHAAQSALAPGGAVIWTRGAFADVDLRPQVRAWFREAGYDELAYEGETAGYGVGLNRAGGAATIATLPARLFTFTR